MSQWVSKGSFMAVHGLIHAGLSIHTDRYELSRGGMIFMPFNLNDSDRLISET